MIRNAIGTSFAALIAVATVAPAYADSAGVPDRPHLVAQMKQSCYSSNTNSDPTTKAKCGCFAQAFVDSLTPGEIASPKPSAAIQAKLRAARHTCNFGE